MQFPFCKRYDISLGIFPIINHLNRRALQKPLTGISVLLPIKQALRKKKKKTRETIQQGPLLSCFSKFLCTKCTENLVLVDNRNQVSMNLFKSSQKKQELVKA